MRRIFLGFVLASVAAGLAATAFWLWTGQGTTASGVPLRLALPLLGGMAALSTVNLVLRWLRWHFLTRRLIRSLPTRASLILYFGTLPAFATPLYVGELLRSALAARRLPEARRPVFAVWAMERLADVAVLGLLALVAGGWTVAAGGLGAAALVSAVWIRRRASGRSLRALLEPRVLLVVAALSFPAWAMAVAGLWLLAAGLGGSIDLHTAASVFSTGTLLGGLSLLPLGTGITGSSMILDLQAAGVSTHVSVPAVALFRAGTAWYALALGVLALVRWRHELLAAVRMPRTQDHFDELAAEYGEQIPAAVRERLVRRKTKAMRRWMRRAGLPDGARGLDLGCGQGWYAAEMAHAGYAMSACDRSPPQLDQARRFLERDGAKVTLAAGDARRLPYADASFDFAYAVNVLHHLTGPGARREALDEIVRVLRPGGSFFLHEINTENPLFAFYMGYMFPLLRDIDDGTEVWMEPRRLPPVEGGRWAAERTYLTFLPDFAPAALLRLLGGLEKRLEASPLRRWSAHFVARLERTATGVSAAAAPARRTSSNR